MRPGLAWLGLGLCWVRLAETRDLTSSRPVAETATNLHQFCHALCANEADGRGWNEGLTNWAHGETRRRARRLW